MAEEEELIYLRQENSQLREQVKQLTEEVKRLQEQLAKNSQNSSLPPSSDRFSRQKKTRSQRQKSGRKQGGQPGHPGQTRLLSQEPDERIRLSPVTHCEHCQTDLSEVPAKTVERRQVIEVPPPPALHITQYKGEW
jgi:hypothetical protein